MFFVVGQRALELPDVVRRIARDGHALGNHSFDHPDLTRLTMDQVRDQLARTSATIERLTGERPRIFRPPFGLTTPAIDELASELGMSRVHWDVETFDWRDPGVGSILGSLLSAPAGSTILMHDGPAGRSQTVAALRLALARPAPPRDRRSPARREG